MRSTSEYIYNYDDYDDVSEVSEIKREKKFTSKNIYNSKPRTKKADHKHQYAKCIFNYDIEDTAINQIYHQSTIGEYCTICGKIKFDTFKEQYTCYKNGCSVSQKIEELKKQNIPEFDFDYADEYIKSIKEQHDKSKQSK